ncbi:SDR family NAD(P)-dependent oxidoreductase [Chlamydiota bacterium]
MHVTDKKVVLITGGARGLGLVLVEEFLKNKFAVIINYYASHKKVQSLEKQALFDQENCQFYKADISDHRAVTVMVENCIKKWGRIDVLINNASIAEDALLKDIQGASWDNVISVNLTGVFHVVKQVLKQMVKQKNGSIITVASYLGICGGKGVAHYAASKGGVIGLTKTIAREYGNFQIRCNAVCPGFMLTDMSKKVTHKFVEIIQKQNALGILNDPKEVARFIVFLAGMEQVSGQVFNLDSRILP